MRDVNLTLRLEDATVKACIDETNVRMEKLMQTFREVKWVGVDGKWVKQ